MEPSWQPYSGPGEIALVAALALVTTLFAIRAARFGRPVPGPSASGGTVAFVVIAWLLAIVAFLADLVVYGLQAREVGLVLPSPPNHVTPVTLSSAVVSFVVVVVLTRARLRTRIGNALICACAGPMVFELPFDLIVMTRTTAVPPAPGLYVALFFLPLFAIEVLTLGLLATRPGARATRWTAICLAGMFGVFAYWAVLGFSYPFGGLPLVLNIVSKVLAFATAVSVVIGPRPGANAPRSANDRPAVQPVTGRGQADVRESHDE